MISSISLRKAWHGSRAQAANTGGSSQERASAEPRGCSQGPAPVAQHLADLPEPLLQLLPVDLIGRAVHRAVSDRKRVATGS